MFLGVREMVEAELIYDPGIWQTVVNGLIYDFYHLPAYVELSAQQEKGTAALFVSRKENCLFCLPLIIRPI
jgi:hypothetical protein